MKKNWTGSEIKFIKAACYYFIKILFLFFKLEIVFDSDSGQNPEFMTW